MALKRMNVEDVVLPGLEKHDIEIKTGRVALFVSEYNVK